MIKRRNFVRYLQPKERAKIYRQAAERIHSGEWIYTGACLHIAAVAFGNHERWLEVQQWEELSRFKPAEKTSIWWDSGENVPRIICLLFCEQMALDENKLNNLNSKNHARRKSKSARRN